MAVDNAARGLALAALAASSGSSTANAVTFDNSGSGAASGTTFNGSAAKTISTNTIGALKASNNLSDVTAATARTNLGLGTAATQSTGTFLQTANNLSDVASLNTTARNLQAGYVLAQSGVQVSHTGDTAEFTFATVTIPAGAIGANGQVVIEALFGASGSSSKTPKVKFGGTVVAAGNAVTTSLNISSRNRVSNRNAAGSQVFVPPGNTTGFGSSGAAVGTASIDTTAAVDIVFTGTLTNSAESISLEEYSIIIYPKA